MKHVQKVAALSLFALMIFATALVWPSYRGSYGHLLLFDATFLAMVLMALPRPRSYAYSFLAAFLFLGFWSKFFAHQIFDYPFVEPTGSFDGSGASWNAVLVASSLAALGVALARLLFLALRLPRESWREGDAPLWYPALRFPLWAVSLVAILVLNAVNLVYGFIQIGLEARLLLPAQLNIVAAWLVNVGFALWLATLVFWEGRTRPDGLGLALFAPLLEGLLSASSMLSRKNFLFHAVPYALVLLEKRAWRATLGRATKLALAVTFVALFAVSLITVSAARLYAYLPPEPTQNPGVQEEPIPEQHALGAARVSAMASQVAGLAVDRWTGLEGIMAVSSYRGLGRNLFLKGITEDPNAGESAIYQQISGAGRIYAESQQTTFLTLPGSAAIMLLSGSAVVVLVGMGTISALLILVESAVLRLLGNPFLASISGVLTAYVVVDLNFPYLGAVFLAELAATLVFIWFLQVGMRSLRVGQKRRTT